MNRVNVNVREAPCVCVSHCLGMRMLYPFSRVTPLNPCSLRLTPFPVSFTPLQGR